MGELTGFGLGGAVKWQKLFPPVPLTAQIERSNAQARRPAGRRGFDPKKIIIEKQE